MDLEERGEDEETVSKRTYFEKLEEALKKYMKSLITLIIGAIVTLILERFRLIVPYLTIETVGFSMTIVGLVITFWYVRSIGRDLAGLINIFIEGLGVLAKEIRSGFNRFIKIFEKRTGSDQLDCPSSDRDTEGEEEVKTTGAGVLAGMIIGGAIGLLGGLVGVLLGGIIGAFIGNQVEYVQEKERRRREKERKRRLEAFLKVIKEKEG